jgi:uncharacterized protein (DUF2252 family)
MAFSALESCAFIAQFEAALALSKSILSERQELMLEDVHVFFRMNPSLFIARFRDEFENAKLCWVDAREKRFLALGDCHLGNFGTFFSGFKKTAWGISDFDHVLNYRAELDLARLATSIHLAAHVQSIGKATDAVHEMIAAYACAKKNDAGSYLKDNETAGPVKALIDEVNKKGESRFEKKYLKADTLRFGDTIEAIDAVVLAQLQTTLNEFAKSLYSPDIRVPVEVVSAGHLIGKGGSSYGLPRFICLIRQKGDLENVAVEFKQLGPHFDARSGEMSIPDAKLVVGQLAVQNPLAGSVPWNESTMLIRQIQPQKDRIKDDEVESLEDLISISSQAGTVLGRFHRNQGWFKFDSAAIEKELPILAEKLAEETEATFAQFSKG